MIKVTPRLLLAGSWQRRLKAIACIGMLSINTLAAPKMIVSPVWSGNDGLLSYFNVITTLEADKPTRYRLEFAFKDAHAPCLFDNTGSYNYRVGEPGAVVLRLFAADLVTDSVVSYYVDYADHHMKMSGSCQLTVDLRQPDGTLIERERFLIENGTLKEPEHAASFDGTVGYVFSGVDRTHLMIPVTLSDVNERKVFDARVTRMECEGRKRGIPVRPIELMVDRAVLIGPKPTNFVFYGYFFGGLKNEPDDFNSGAR